LASLPTRYDPGELPSGSTILCGPRVRRPGAGGTEALTAAVKGMCDVIALHDPDVQIEVVIDVVRDDLAALRLAARSALSDG
jgi:hypothetical protein